MIASKNIPEVSIVMPMYNSESYIRESIISVLNQTFKSFELICVDDCSQDGTVELVREFCATDDRVVLHRLSSNSGAAVSRNLAIKESRGRYIAFLDSDDLWKPNKLEYQVKFMKDNSIAFTCSAYLRVSEEGAQIDVVTPPEAVTYYSLLKVCTVGCLTAMYDTELLGKVYMPLIRKRQDLGLWLRLLSIVPFCYGIQEPLAAYRVRPDSISANKITAARYTWRLYREVEQLPFLRAVYYFCHYAKNGLLRNKLKWINYDLRKG